MKILSLGAGVQSSTILLMSAFGEIEKPDCAIFADTGWEPQAVYDWFDYISPIAESNGIPIHIVTQGNINDDALVSRASGKRAASMPYYTLSPDGDIGIIRRQCTYEYKIRPIERKIRELLGYEPRKHIKPGSVETWKGISIDEMRRATISSNKWQSFYYPLIAMRIDRQDCFAWFKSHKLPLPPRSACLGCPFHSNKEWKFIKETSPNEWTDLVEFDKKIRNCGGLRGQVFLHRSCLPLDQVDFSTKAEKAGQVNMWDNECAGVCGV